MTRPEPDRSEAKPEDVATIDGVMAAFYEVVNVAPDGPRQWARDRALHIQDVRFVSISGRGDVRLWDHATYVRETEPLIQSGFFEREVHRIVRRYGAIAHVFSTYEVRDRKDGPMARRGLNSLQLFFDGTRWWVASVTWQGESPDRPLPAEFLPPAP